MAVKAAFNRKIDIPGLFLLAIMGLMASYTPGKFTFGKLAMNAFSHHYIYILPMAF
jgi:hypothetical protein